MSDKPDNGGPAFPKPPSVDLREFWDDSETAVTPTASPGMSLAAYFAGQALAAVNSNDLYYGTVGNPKNPWPGVAEDCYNAAVAMIAEGRKRGLL